MRSLVVSGPSGVGKTTLNQLLLNKYNSFQLVVSLTTRLQRANEIQGIHYHFINQNTFNHHLHNNDFVEHQSLFGNSYGTLKSELQMIQEKGKVPLFEIDIQGALQIHQQMKANFLFITPANNDQLKQRLVNRKTESEDSLNKRVTKGIEEMKEARGIDIYDFLVNDELDSSFKSFEQWVMGKYKE